MVYDVRGMDDDINQKLEWMRAEIRRLEANVIENKEFRRIAEVKKNNAESEYGYYDMQVAAAQKKITNINNTMNSILSETGV